MRISLLFTAFLLLVLNAAGQKQFTGYVVTRTGDTLASTILRPTQFLLFYRNVKENKNQTYKDAHEVTVVDSASGIELRYAAKDLLGFGFKEGRQTHHFVTMRDTSGGYLFVERVADGPGLKVFRQKLYLHTSESYVGSGDVVTLVYRIEKTNGEGAFFREADRIKTTKAALKKFFAGTPNLDMLLWGRFLHGYHFEDDLLYLVSRINDPGLPLVVRKNGF